MSLHYRLADICSTIGVSSTVYTEQSYLRAPLLWETQINPWLFWWVVFCGQNYPVLSWSRLGFLRTKLPQVTLTEILFFADRVTQGYPSRDLSFWARRYHMLPQSRLRLDLKVTLTKTEKILILDTLLCLSTNSDVHL